MRSTYCSVVSVFVRVFFLRLVLFMTAALATLKKHLADLVPLSPSEGEITGLASGIAALDAALPARGIPIGRLTELLGTRGSGKTTFLRHLVQETLGQKRWVAYVDASRTLVPQDWADLGGQEAPVPPSSRSAHNSQSTIRSPQSDHGLWMIRPASPSRGTWCADVLLRSGAFALVVLDGTPPLSRSVAVRLTRLARSAGAALIVTGEESAAAIPGALRLRIERGKMRRTRNCELRTANGELPTANCELRTTNHKSRIRDQPEIKQHSSQFAASSSQLDSLLAVSNSQSSSQ
ncbi:MAG: DNA recombination/repair protein RecA, partial [Gemmatimonadota bacterium]|nr:DNA recombination/repair protein RecA [Gemmatimonadota bacterium]